MNAIRDVRLRVMAHNKGLLSTESFGGRIVLIGVGLCRDL